MKNDFTDLHNEFRDNLKQINQKQLNENFVQLLEQQLNEVGSRPSLYDSPGNKFANKPNVGGGLKQAGSAALDAVGRGLKKLPKGRVDLGKLIFSPGDYATEYDPEKLLKKGFTKAGNWAQSKVSGTAAFIGNQIFGAKEREYRNYVKNGIKKDRKRLIAQLNAMKKLRGLSSQRMARELQKALAEYLSTKKYDKIIKLKFEETIKKLEAKRKKEIRREGQRNEEIEQNSSESILNEIMDRTIKGRLGDQFRANHALGSKENIEALKIIGQHQNNLRGAIEIYIMQTENKRIDQRSKKAMMYHAMEYCVARVFEKYLPEQIFLSSANPVLEYNPARKKDYKTLEDPTVFFPTWMLYIQEGLRPNYKRKEEDRERAFDKKSEKIVRGIAGKHEEEELAKERAEEEQREREYRAKKEKQEEKELKEKEKKNERKREERKRRKEEREKERDKAQLDLFGEATEQLGLFDDEERKVKQREKEAKEQEAKKRKEEQEKYEAEEKHTKRLPSFKQMIEFASNLRSFRTISTYVNYDNIVNHIKAELENLDAREAGLAGSDRANYFMTPLQKIDSKLKAIAKGISARELKLNQMRKAFANWDDEDKKQHEKKYKEEYEKIRTERNNMANTYTTIKARRSKFLDGEDLTQSELDDLENLKPEQQNNKENDKGDKKDDKKDDPDVKDANTAMGEYHNLMAKIRSKLKQGFPLTDEEGEAEKLIARILKGKIGMNRQQLQDMFNAAKETQKESYSKEFQMKDFDYLAEKFIQRESSPLLESMPMIRFRRNPREGTNKIAMVCGKDEFKKSLNRTINIAGKKVKDVMCLPKQLKSAKERLKDRKASIKRWRKIRVNSVTVERMNRKKQETKKASRTLRK